jgi:hypothetical protein
MSSELPQPLLDLIRGRIPTFQAAELLVFLASNRDRSFAPDEVVSSMPNLMDAPALREYMASFIDGGLIDDANGRLRYRPASQEIEEGMDLLVAAYNERPVTLITVIYRLADDRAHVNQPRAAEAPRSGNH